MDLKTPLRRRLPHRVAIVLALVAALAPVLPATVHAADFTPGCGDAAGLQLAVTDAGANDEPDTITLSAGCVFALTSTLSVAADGGNLLTIEGNGATISGTNSHRVFNIAAGADVSIDGLTITDGDNSLEAPDTFGAGIRNAGDVTLTDSLLIANVNAENGGGIFNAAGATMDVTNTTITGNQAFRGSGVYNAGTMTVTNGTVTQNLLSGSGASGIASAGTLTAKNTIVSDNHPANHNCGGVTDGGNNIQFGGSDPGTCTGFTEVDPQLAPLAFNGGPTRTFALAAGSPAIDAGTSSGAPSTDQRGATRDGDPDIGAYEFAPYTFVPNDTNDPTPSGCIEGDCSLREAVIAANTAPGPDVIDLDSSVYAFVLSGQEEDVSTTGDLDITDDVEIRGDGAGNSVIDGNALDRVFHVLAGASAVITDLTVQNGSLTAHNDDGGGTFSCTESPGFDTTCGWGSGIYNAGTVVIEDAAVRSNVNTGTSGTQNALGGGILNHGGTMTLRGSLVEENEANGTAIFGGSGVGSFNRDATVATITVEDSTIMSNEGGAGLLLNGSNSTVSGSTISGNDSTSTGVPYGGIYADNGFSLSITNSTISGNISPGFGAGMYTRVGGALTNVTIANNSGNGVYDSDGADITASNTIIVDNSGANCHTGIATSGHNIDDDFSCAFTGTGDQQNTDPGLSSLNDNGGPTRTHAIGTGSAAYNNGDCDTLVDQRGVARPQAGGCDVGAFELDEAAPDTGFDAVPNGNSNDSSPTFEFNSSEAGSTFECNLDNAGFDECGAVETFLLGDGSHTLLVRAMDIAGNIDTTPASYTWTIDTTAPGTPTVINTDPVSPGKDATPIINGSAVDDFELIELFTGNACNTSIGTTQADDFGDWSFQTTTAVADGSTTQFTAKAFDAAGNTSACSNAVGYTADLSTVTPSITGSTPASPANNNNPTINGTAEADAIMQLYSDSSCSTAISGAGGDADGSGAWSIDPPGTVADDSETDYYARATDQAGNNSSCSTKFTYVEDSTAPSAPSITGSTPASPANNNSPTINGTAAAGAQIQLFVDSGCNAGLSGAVDVADGSGDWSINPNDDVANDSSTDYFAKATDAAGNGSACSAGFSYVEDSTSPTATITSVPFGTTPDQTPTFTFSSSESGSTFECSIDQGVADFDPCSGPGASHTPSSNLSEGSYTFRVRATDQAANTGAADTEAFTVDLIHQPDAKIKRASDVGFSFDNIYDATGASETITVKSKIKKTVTFPLDFENDGNLADTFTLTGCASSKGFSVKYLDGATDVTAQVTGAGLSSGSLAVGAEKALTLSIKIGKKASGKKKTCLVTATSNGSPTVSDAVIGRIKVK